MAAQLKAFGCRAAVCAAVAGEEKSLPESAVICSAADEPHMLCGAVRPEAHRGCPRDRPGTRLGLLNNMTFALNNFHGNSATVGTKCLHASFGARILYASRYNKD